MVLFDQLRGIVREGDARVKAHATVEHHHIALRTGGQIHSFLSLRIESGFGGILSFLSELSQVRAPTAGELFPPLGHRSSDGGRVTPSTRVYFPSDAQ